MVKGPRVSVFQLGQGAAWLQDEGNAGDDHQGHDHQDKDHHHQLGIFLLNVVHYQLPVGTICLPGCGGEASIHSKIETPKLPVTIVCQNRGGLAITKKNDYSEKFYGVDKLYYQ